jgi:hypothetical protein
MRKPPYYKRLVELVKRQPDPDCLRVYCGDAAWPTAQRRVALGQRFVVCPDDVEPSQVDWSVRGLARYGMSRTEAMVFVYGAHAFERTKSLVVALMQAGFELVLVIHADNSRGLLRFRKESAHG